MAAVNAEREGGGDGVLKDVAKRESGQEKFRIIAVTDRRLAAGDYFERIERIVASGADAVIVREKDLPEGEYRSLARRVMEICGDAGADCILHTFAETAAELGCRKIHLPLPLLRKLRGCGVLGSFQEIGVSVHSLEEAKEAEKSGASYVTAGHIFVTDCKKGAAPRGLDFLREIVEGVSVPVYGIGGISRGNVDSIRETGAAGACIMSQMMKGEFYEERNHL